MEMAEGISYSEQKSAKRGRKKFQSSPGDGTED
jgi:hypothetical protein